MINSSPIANHHLLAMMLAAFCGGLFFSSLAFACDIQVGLVRNDRIANIEKRLAANEGINAKQRALYEEFKRDSATYLAAHNSLWPVCSEQGGTDCFPNCSEVSAKDFAEAPFVTNGVHYRVQPEEAKELRSTQLFLINKWKH